MATGTNLPLSQGIAVKQKKQKSLRRHQADALLVSRDVFLLKGEKFACGRW